MTPDNAPHRALRHHVTGAIERGEAEPIVGIPADIQKLYEEADLYREIIADEYATPTQKNSARRELALVEEALANKEA